MESGITMLNVKISVIMPVFNDEEYIEESLNSILNQTLKEVEVICINDGSTDNSLDIIESFDTKFYKLTIINQQNLGSGVARNNGMKIAQGDYIAFLDADDIFVDSTALEEMYELAIKNNADMVSANLKGITVKGEIVNNEVLTRFSEEKIISPQDYEIPFSYYKNIFKRSFLNENNITFPDLRRGQDPVFLAEILTKVDQIPVTPINLYGFRYSPIGGLNKIDTFEKKFDYIKHFKETFDILRNANFNEMYNLYLKKLEEYLKHSNNSSDEVIFNSFNRIFENDEEILNKFSNLFDFNKTKISIIFPIYNSAQLLEKSIKSVLNQTLSNIELICIDDGSTDNTLEILQKYESKYDFIKVYSQNNQGTAKARNFGLEVATGDYIAFLDVNDYFMKYNSLEKLYGVAIENDADMVSGNMKIINPDNEIINFDELEIFNMKKTIFPKDYGMPKAFNKNIFKRSFLIKNKILFPNLLKASGIVFLAEILSKIEKIIAYPIDFYVHFYDNNLSRINTNQEIFDYISHFKQTSDYLIEGNLENINHEYRYELINSIKEIPVDFVEIYLNAFREIYKGDSCFLRGVEYYFYYLYNNNPDLKDIIKLNLDVNHPRVSIVIPVYNAEDFLDKSIPSLLNQTLSDIELVCVNDGSKDNSLQLLNKYASSDNRVKIIDQENGGCGAARNKSLDNTKGDYVYFFDPDDFLVENALEELYLNAFFNDSELVLFKLAFWIEGKPIDYSQPHFNLDEFFKGVDFNRFTFNRDDIKRYVMNARAFAPWFKLYKHDLLNRYDDFYFPVNLPFDDVPFHIKSLLRAKRMSFVPDFFYHYKIDNPNSVNSKPSNAMGIIEIINIVENFLKNDGYFANFEKEFYNFKFFHTYIYLFRAADPEEYFQEVKRQYLKIKSEFFDKNEENKNFIDPFLFEIYDMIINSNTFMEYKLRFSFSEIKKENSKLLKSNEKVLSDNKSLINEKNELTNRCNQLNVDNKRLIDEIENLTNRFKTLTNNPEYISLNENTDEQIKNNQKINDQKQKIYTLEDQINNLNILNKKLYEENNRLNIQIKKGFDEYKINFTNELKEANDIANLILLDLNDNYLTNLKAFLKIKELNLFDYEFYKKEYNYHDLINPILHYIYRGCIEGKKPNPNFDRDFYVQSNENVLKSNLDPFIYFALYGIDEGKIKIHENAPQPGGIINKKEIDKHILEFNELGVDKQKDSKIIISLTSFPQRMYDIHYTLYSLLNQSFKPYSVVLWLAESQFPHKEKDLPQKVLSLKENGLEIRWCEDLGSYKKLLPSLKMYPDDIIVTADDDIYYPEHWLKELYESHLKYPNEIISCRARKILLSSENELAKYADWDVFTHESKPSYFNFATNGAGSLIPPNSYDKKILDYALAKNICSTTDDIWFWAMSVLNDTKTYVIENCMPWLTYVNPARDFNILNEKTLWSINSQNKNDINFERILDYFPIIKEKIFNEFKENQ